MLGLSLRRTIASQDLQARKLNEFRVKNKVNLCVGTGQTGISATADRFSGSFPHTANHGQVALGVLSIANITQIIVEDHQPLFSVHYHKPRG